MQARFKDRGNWGMNSETEATSVWHAIIPIFTSEKQWLSIEAIPVHVYLTFGMKKLWIERRLLLYKNVPRFAAFNISTADDLQFFRF